MMDRNDVFATLKSSLAVYEANLTVVHDNIDNYYLDIPILSTNQKSEFFGAVQLRKSFVSYHLMPIYHHPDLLANISDQLRNRMQGKSCFNFLTIDDLLFSELATLTKVCFDRYRLLHKV